MAVAGHPVARWMAGAVSKHPGAQHNAEATLLRPACRLVHRSWTLGPRRRTSIAAVQAARCARVLLSGAFGAGLVLAVAGCAAPIHTSDPCMPPAYTLESPVAAPGETLGISAPGATCNPGYGKDAQVRIELVDNQQQVVSTELAPMSDDGAFTHDLRIPGGTTPGSYGITAIPDGMDWCDDTGRDNRLCVADLGVNGISAARASCAVPRIGFQVTT